MSENRKERYWSRFASSYDADGEYVVGKPILQAIEQALLREHALGKAIELGCGTGYFTQAIARNAEHVIATDLSDQMLQVARTRLDGLERVTIQKADCAQTSFSDNSFDSVFLLNLIHVIDDPSQCLQETHRILKNGGLVVIVDFTGYGMALFKKLGLVLRYLRAWGLPPRDGQDAMSPSELRRLVQHAGFAVKDIQLLRDGANALYLRGTKE
jgi:ABC-2 type transport system ATP-binding protein